MSSVSLYWIGVLLAIAQGSTQTGTSPSSSSKHVELAWWQTGIIYQIYPRSFQDSSASGTGDLRGIVSKIDYLKTLGIGAVWLSPIYASPMADFGYDISNFIDVDPVFGTLEDFDALAQALREQGLKLIMDFVPNHTSDKHEWFEKSLNRLDPFTDYYVWVDSKGLNSSGQPIPPNNWLSVFGYSAWQWSPQRQQFYLHQFLDSQPDLNVRNAKVMQELDNTLKFWLDRGVDGFRVDAIKHMFEVEDYSMDEPMAAITVTDDPKDYYSLDHPFTSNLPDTLQATRHWRSLMDTYQDKAMIVEVYDGDVQQIMNYYGTQDEPIANFPFNFDLIVGLSNRSDVTGFNLKHTLDKWLDYLPAGKWPNWVLGNHDRGRVASRLGRDLVDALHMLILLLKGTATTYNGEEIGMEDTFVTFEQAKDPFALNFGPEEYTKYGRDPNRSPMQWDSSPNAGFSKANDTWLPINSNYKTVNVEVEMEAEQSVLKVYQALALLRQNITFTHGQQTFAKVTSSLFSFVRSLDGEQSYLVVINTSDQPTTADLLTDSSVHLPAQGTLQIRSSFDERSETNVGSTVELSSISLLGSEGLVIRLDH